MPEQIQRPDETLPKLGLDQPALRLPRCWRMVRWPPGPVWMSHVLRTLEGTVRVMTGVDGFGCQKGVGFSSFRLKVTRQWRNHVHVAR